MVRKNASGVLDVALSGVKADDSHGGDFTIGLSGVQGPSTHMARTPFGVLQDVPPGLAVLPTSGGCSVLPRPQCEQLDPSYW